MKQLPQPRARVPVPAPRDNDRARLAIRVVIADHRTLVREALSLLLSLRAGVVVVGDAENLDTLSTLLDRVACDVILLDVGLGTGSLVDVEALSTHAKILTLSDADQVDEAIATIRAGATGAVFKHSTPDALLDAILTVAAGRSSLPSELQSRLADSLHDDPRRRLTRREREVIRHVALGRRNSEIAHTLFISEQTVKAHMSHIFRKTGIRGRVELTLYAVQLGIISAHERRK